MDRRNGGDPEHKVVPGHTVRLLVVGYLLGGVAALVAYWLVGSLILSAILAFALAPVFVLTLAVVGPRRGIFGRRLPDEGGCR